MAIFANVLCITGCLMLLMVAAEVVENNQNSSGEEKLSQNSGEFEGEKILKKLGEHGIPVAGEIT